MSNTAAKVFAVPELLEAILLLLTPRDLLLAQRVNKTFRASIKASVLIQQKLFFKPNTKNLDDGTCDLNPLLSRILTLAGREWNPYLVCPTDLFPCRGNVTMIHFARDVGLQVNGDMIVPYLVNPDGYLTIRGVNQTSARVVDTSLESEQSWQDMLVADPPCLVKIRDGDSTYTFIPESMKNLMQVLDMGSIEHSVGDAE